MTFTPFTMSSKYVVSILCEYVRRTKVIGAKFDSILNLLAIFFIIAVVLHFSLEGRTMVLIIKFPCHCLTLNLLDLIYILFCGVGYKKALLAAKFLFSFNYKC